MPIPRLLLQPETTDLSVLACFVQRTLRVQIRNEMKKANLCTFSREVRAGEGGVGANEWEATKMCSRNNSAPILPSAFLFSNKRLPAVEHYSRKSSARPPHIFFFQKRLFLFLILINQSVTVGREFTISMLNSRLPRRERTVRFDSWRWERVRHLFVWKQP